jgi:hypothetical protein
MANNKHYSKIFTGCILCPNCGSTAQQGFDFENLHCSTCGTQHFSLGDVPCLFPAGNHHTVIWQHQTATMQHMALQGLAALEESLSRYDLTAISRQRLTDIHTANQLNLESILVLLQKHGINPVPNDQLGQMNPGDISEYFDLIFRDWAWDSASTPSLENTSALQRTMQLLADLPTKPQRILVLGAGAGRLSWDIHTQLKPEFTVALDSNPLLLAAASELIYNQKPLTFGEFKNFPQINYPVTQNWTLNAVDDPENLRNSWFLMGANVWQLPFIKKTFDLIITPWFIDVNGGDVRDLIGLIHEQLADNGHWINSGPLLFTRHLPTQLKYTAAEIKEFIELSGFSFCAEEINNTGYLLSPLEARFREEQVWSFSTQKRMPLTETIIQTNAWLIMHHLPIPTLNFTCQDSHPLIDIILAKVDGIRSINEICFEVAMHIPEGIAVKDVVVTLFGQIMYEQ